MIGLEVGGDVLANIGFLVVALVLGEPLLRLCERLLERDPGPGRPTIGRLGAAWLVGIGAAGYVGVLLGAVRLFYWWALVVVALAVVVLGRRTLVAYGRAALASAGGLGRPDPLTLFFLAVAAAFFVTNYGAAIAPARQWDEMAYHLPDARRLADSHALPLSFGDNYFYGNLPKLMEVVYAEGKTISGDALAHLLHMSVLLALGLFLFGTVRSLYGARAAALGLVFLGFYDELMLNASTAYVDAASACLEAAAVVSVAGWVTARRERDLGWAALFIGLALSVKYSPAAALVFLACVVLVVALVSRGWTAREIGRAIVPLAAIVAVAAGYWYLKNLVRFGNPFYPLYFGHRGVSDEAYQGLLTAIQAFRPRTFENFLETPLAAGTASLVYKSYPGLLQLPTILSFVIAPFALFVRRARPFAIVLVVYFVLYASYWFWLASHQARFLMPAVIATSILSGIVLVCARRPLVYAGIALAIAGALVGYRHSLPSPTWDELRAEAAIKFRTTDWRYTLGRKNKDEYLSGVYGCHYDAVAYVVKNDLPGRVIDDWTIYTDAPVDYYAGPGRFAPLSAPSATPKEIWREVRRNDFRYLYVRVGGKLTFFQRDTPDVVAWRRAHLPSESVVLASAKPVWREGDCTIFRLNRPGERA